MTKYNIFLMITQTALMFLCVWVGSFFIGYVSTAGETPLEPMIPLFWGLVILAPIAYALFMIKPVVEALKASANG